MSQQTLAGNLKGYSSKELTGLKADIKVEEERRRKVRSEDLRSTLLQNLDSLLAVIKHTRTSCSDESLVNAYYNKSGAPDCTRCILLKAKEDEGFYDELSEFWVQVYIQIKR